MGFINETIYGESIGKVYACVVICARETELVAKLVTSATTLMLSFDRVREKSGTRNRDK